MLKNYLKTALRNLRSKLAYSVINVVGLAIGSTAGSDGDVIGAVAGAAIGVVADALVKDVRYTVVTDLQISEKLSAGTDGKLE